MNFVKISLIISLAIFCSSCKNEVEFDSNAEVAGVLTREFNDTNDFIKSSINEKISNAPEHIKAQIQSYDSITKDYINYLSKLEKSLDSKKNNPFFEGDMITTQSKEYMNKTKTYYSGISKYSSDKNLSEQMKRFISTQDYKNPDDIYLNHLEYYFKGWSPIQFKALISHKKLSVLYIENQVIDNMIINDLKLQLNK